MIVGCTDCRFPEPALARRPGPWQKKASSGKVQSRGPIDGNQGLEALASAKWTVGVRLGPLMFARQHVPDQQAITARAGLPVPRLSGLLKHNAEIDCNGGHQ